MNTFAKQVLKPHTVVNAHGVQFSSPRHGEYNGWYLYSKGKNNEHLIHFKNGKVHNYLLSAGVLYKDSALMIDAFRFIINGDIVTERLYWKAMYEDYKDTEHEDLILSHILGSE